MFNIVHKSTKNNNKQAHQFNYQLFFGNVLYSFKPISFNKRQLFNCLIWWLWFQGLKNLHSEIWNSPCKIKSDVEFDGLTIVLNHNAPSWPHITKPIEHIQRNHRSNFRKSRFGYLDIQRYFALSPQDDVKEKKVEWCVGDQQGDGYQQWTRSWN